MIESVVTGFIVVVLGLAGLLTLVRIVRGPSVLDRAIASEVMITVLVCALGAEAALARHTTTLPILVSLSLLGFVGSVAVVRFVPTDMDPRGAALPDAVLAENEYPAVERPTPDAGGSADPDDRSSGEPQ